MLGRRNRNERRALAMRILAYLRPYRRETTVALAATVVSAAIGVVPILAIKILIDRLTAHTPHFSALLVPVVVAIAAAAVAALAGVASTYALTRISEGVVFDLRREVFDGLIEHGAAFYIRSRGGDVLSRLLNDVGGIDTTLSTTLLGFAQSALVTVATLAVMVYLDWRLTIICVVLMPLAITPTRRAGTRISRARRAVQEQFADVTAYLQETLGLSGMLLVRVFGRQVTERRRFGELNAELRRREIAAAMTARWFGASLSLLAAVVPAVLLLAGGYLVIHGRLTPGTAIVFATLVAFRLGTALQGMANAAAAGLGSVALWRRIFELLDTAPEIAERTGAATLRDVRGSIRLEDVTFSYPGQAQPAVREVSFEVEPGQVVALVGPSGAGKTTIGALVARLLDPDEGSVSIDGHDVRDLTLASVSDAVSVVLQDTFLFHATLDENLRYGRPDATERELDEAAADSQLDGVVAALPDRYDTVVGERGYRLSGGEKQRVAIARALLKDPRILILDEATSHLDTASERLLQHALQRLMHGRTAIVIAHRLSTIVNADSILVLDGGRIVERGTHDELIAHGGVYAHLYGLQTDVVSPNSI